MKDASELKVAGNGGIFVAPVGSTLPVDVDSPLDGAFVDTGYATEDGVTFRYAPEITDHRGWQSAHPLRRDLTNVELDAVFGLLQWNEETIRLAFGGGEVTEPSDGVFRYDFPEAGDEIDERAAVVETIDGDRKDRFVIARCNPVEAVETQFQRASTAVLPITLRALQPDSGVVAYYLTNDEDAFGS